MSRKERNVHLSDQTLSHWFDIKRTTSVLNVHIAAVIRISIIPHCESMLEHK